jgi:hypothetical protein
LPVEALGKNVARTPPPWTVKSVPPGLEKTRACLLGVGLSLYRRPAEVRSEAFLRALAAWWDAPPLPTRESKLAVDRRDGLGEDFSSSYHGVAALDTGEVLLSGVSPPGAEGVQSEPIGRRQIERVPERRSLGRSGSEGERNAVAESGSVGEVVDQIVEDDDSPTRGLSVRHLPEGLPETDERAASVALGQEKRPSEPVPGGQPGRKTADIPVTAAPVDFEGGLYTELGGILYLINLMAHLDLPACFEDDWGLESQVGSWGVLELLGRGLLAWESVECKEDSLWAALARLDGREPGELPGETFVGGECFRLPVEWFAGLGDGEDGVYRYAARRGWLCLWSEAGYVLADVPRDAAPPKTQAATELRRYLGATASALTRAAFDCAPLACLDGPLVAGLKPYLARWLALVLPAVRLRLRLALNPPEGEAWNLAEVLLLCPGRLYITSTHVDLVMSLDSISLSARMAGLDRNPGWMADLGRVVSFHFE